MATCKIKKCEGISHEGKYCGFHQRKFAARVIHGKTATPEVLGVPKRYESVYQDFLENPKPFDLRSEMAMLRTLYLELREHLDSQTMDKLDKVSEAVLNDLTPLINGDPEKVRYILTSIGQSLRSTMMEQMDISWSASKDNVRELSDLLEKISRVAERMKKIQEGAKLEISLDVNLITKILTMAVLPEVPDPMVRARIMQKASMLAVSTTGERDKLEAELIFQGGKKQEIPAVFVDDGEDDGDPFPEDWLNKEDDPEDIDYLPENMFSEGVVS